MNRKTSQNAQHVEPWGGQVTTAEDHVKSTSVSQEMKAEAAVGLTKTGHLKTGKT